MFTSTRFRVAFVGAVGAVALMLPSCGSTTSTTASSTGASASSTTTAPTVVSSSASVPGSTVSDSPAAGSSATLSSSAAATDVGAGGAVVPLVIYSAQGYDAVVTKAFTAATGIPVKLVDDSTGPLLTKIAAEKNNPQWSLLWVDGDTAFASLDGQGQLLPFTPSTPLNAVGQALVPKARYVG